MPELILFPYNGNAREAIGVVAALNHSLPGGIHLLGFMDDNAATHGQTFAGYAVLGGREVLQAHPTATVLAVPGRPENFRQRAALIASLQLPKARFARLIHPSAVIGPEVQIGMNTLIMAHVTLTAGIQIGNHVVVLPGTVIAHESHIEDYCLIGANCVLAGGVTLRRGCYVGSGSRLIQEITVGPETLIGLGAVVTSDLPAHVTAVGCPARVL